jgi:phosphate:Na+ symporter
VSPLDASRQIANAHTAFNVGNALVFIWFTGPMARLVERIVPASATAREKGKPRYLNAYFISQPPLALDHVRMELARLSTMVGRMLSDSLPVLLSRSQQPMDDLEAADDEVNALHGEIVLYLGQISQQNLGDAEAEKTYESILIANYLENLGDIVDKNLLPGGRKRLYQGIVISESTRVRLESLHRKVCRAFDLVTRAIETGDADAARTAIDSKAGVNEAAEEVLKHLAERLVAREPNRLASFQVEADIVENFKRVNNLTRRIARILWRSATGEAADEEEVAPTGA